MNPSFLLTLLSSLQVYMLLGDKRLNKPDAFFRSKFHSNLGVPHLDALTPLVFLSNCFLPFPNTLSFLHRMNALYIQVVLIAQRLYTLKIFQDPKELLFM